MGLGWVALNESFVYKRHTKWRMFVSIERRDVTLSVDNFIFDIGSVFAEKKPMGTPKYTITRSCSLVFLGCIMSSEQIQLHLSVVCSSLFLLNNFWLIHTRLVKLRVMAGPRGEQ